MKEPWQACLSWHCGGCMLAKPTPISLIHPCLCCREAGDLSATVHHFMSMLRCETSSVQCQRLNLSQFMDAVAAAASQQVGA